MKSLLDNLPARGYFSEWGGPSQARLRSYIADHDTDPPETQRVTTDQTNILIRSLMSRRHRDDRAKADRAREDKAKGKRGPDAPVDATPAKKLTGGPGQAHPENASRGGSAGAGSSGAAGGEAVGASGGASGSQGADGAGSSGSGGASLSKRALDAMTYERLKALCKERNVAARGRKEELVARLLEAEQRPSRPRR